MRHRIGFNRLDRRAGQRKALIKNAVTSLFIHERIKTTKPKALEIRKTAEKMITRAKTDSVHNRRLIAKIITHDEALAKLFTDIAPRYKTRPGGYTRILKLGQRRGDAAEMVILELVESEAIEEKQKQKRKRREAKAEKAEKARQEEERLEKEQQKDEEPPETPAIEEPKAEETPEASDTIEDQEDTDSKEE